MKQYTFQCTLKEHQKIRKSEIVKSSQKLDQSEGGCQGKFKHENQNVKFRLLNHVIPILDMINISFAIWLAKISFLIDS